MDGMSAYAVVQVDRIEMQVVGKIWKVKQGFIIVIMNTREYLGEGKSLRCWVEIRRDLDLQVTLGGDRVSMQFTFNAKRLEPIP